MNGNFYAWLMTQKDRPDAIGDLATDVARDTDFPKETPEGVTTCLIHLQIKRAAPEAVKACADAWVEFNQQ